MRFPMFISSLSALAFVCLAGPAMAQVPLQVPFSGVLELDGAGMTRTGTGVDLELSIWDAETAGNLLYKQTVTGVEVFAGRFTALLGPAGVDAADVAIPIQDAIVGAGPRWVGVILLGIGPAGEDVPLAARKQLQSVPSALFVAEALDFRVRGTATVDGSVTVGPGARAEFASRPGFLYVGQGAQFECSGCGDVGTLFGAGDWNNLTIQGRVLSTDAALHLSPPGGSKVYINDAYRAAGGATGSGGAGLDVQGELVVGGNVRFTNPSLDCAWSGCVDTGAPATFVCSSLVPGYPILGGLDVAIDDGQKPAGCLSTNHEDEIRLYCCRFQ